MSQPILITMDTAPNEDGLRFLKTLRTNGWKYRLIGTDTDWVNFLHRAAIYLKELVQIESKDPNRICVVADCRDVLCVRSPKSFNEAFNEFGKGIVTSAEILCGGYPVKRPELRGNCEDSTPYWNANGVFGDDIPYRKYVNAGLISGRASDLVKMYDWMVKKGLELSMSDDQVLMGMYINQHPDKVALDVNAEMLHSSTFGASIGYMSDFQQYDSPTIAQLLGRQSFFLHLPGAGQKSGNGLIYEMVSKLIDDGYHSKSLLDLLQAVEWPWKRYKFNKFKMTIEDTE